MPGVGQAVGIAHRQVLRAAVAVMHQVTHLRAAALVNGLFERIEDEVGAQRGRDTPADDATRKDVDDERDVDEAAPGRDVREVRDPELIRTGRGESPLDQIRGPRGADIGLRRDRPRPPADRATQPQVSHQTLHGAARHAAALTPQLLPDLPRPIDLLVVVPHALNRGAQVVVALRSGGPGRRGLLLGLAQENTVEGAIGTTRQIGSTPYCARCWSMKRTITSLGGRAPPVRKTPPPSSRSHWRVSVRRFRVRAA